MLFPYNSVNDSCMVTVDIDCMMIVIMAIVVMMLYHQYKETV